MVYMFFEKRSSGSGMTYFLQINLLLNQIINLRMNLINRLLENLREGKFIHLLETIFGLLV